MGWRKRNITVRKFIEETEKESISHEIDHFKSFEKGALALEIEWNNKDPFVDRDLENFKRLHAEGAISVGIIITRDASLQKSLRDFVLRFAVENGVSGCDDLARLNIAPTLRQKSKITDRVHKNRHPVEFARAWADQFVADKFGEATTHWRKLIDRVSRGVGNPVPLALIGLPSSIVRFPDPASSPDTAEQVRKAALETEPEDA